VYIVKTRYWEKYFNGKVKSEGEQFKKADYSSEISFKARYNIIKEFSSGQNLDGVKILDAGCGIGLLKNIVGKACEIIGLDLSAEALKQAKEQGETPIKATVTNIPLKSAFEYVFCIEVLQYIDDWQNAVRELVNMTKNNGFLIISTLNKKCLLLHPKVLKILKKLGFTKMDENIVLHDKEDIVKELEKLGMDIIANKDLPIPIKGGKFLLNVSTILGLRHLFSYSFMIIAKKLNPESP